MAGRAAHPNPSRRTRARARARSFESAQDMTTEEWAGHKKEERLAAEKSAQEECEAMAPGKKSNAYLTLGEMPAMGLLPHETRFLG